MLPRQHGAYGQLVFPVFTVLAVGGASASADLTALAAIAGFLAHEPLLVLLGRRGARAKRDDAVQAIVWFITAAVVAIVAGTAAVSAAPANVRWSFVLPLVTTSATASAILIATLEHAR